MSRIVAAGVALVVVAAAVVPAMAAAGMTGHRIKTGYYADLVVVPSTQVTFHLRRTNRVPDLVLGCSPKDPNIARQAITIAVHAPLLHIRSGHLTYHGNATITSFVGGGPKLGVTTLTITAHHVNGPVHHYVYDGQHLSQTTAWKGTASSPACTTLRRHGAFTLFGPVPGE